MSVDPTDFPETAGPDVAGRAMLVRAAEPVRLECIARGYLFGAAWAEYQEHGTRAGPRLPAGLRQAERLPEPIFTPTTKAESGHDLPLSDAEAIAAGRRRRVTSSCATRRSRSTSRGAAHAAARGLILADTKLEFGSIDGELLVIDEMLTPDSSRYWPADDYEVGELAAVVRQAVRARPLPDHRLGPAPPPVPPLPDGVIAGTRQRYVEAYERLTGRASTTGTAK